MPEDVKACPIPDSQSVLGRLKFVSKNEDNQVYGMSIPDVMINKEIENYKAYQTYLAFLIGTTKVPNVSKDTYEVKYMDEEDWGSEEDDVILISDEERTESKKETTKSGKTNKDLDDEEEHNDDETQKEEHVHDDEYVPDDSEKNEDTDEEMKEVKIAKEGKTNEVMDDVAQANVKKTDEEKVKIEQAGNVQAIEKAQIKDGDQATTIVSVAHKEKLDL
ncbi:hypothetical protein Tco_0268222 [Tanacetum coccineum]